MVDFYTGLAATASRLLTDKGQTLTFSRNTSTGFNPATGVDSITTSNYTGKGAGSSYNRREIDGEIIQMNDVRLIIEAVTTPPLIGDSVTYNGTVYRVMDIKETSPAGIVVIYELKIRR